MRKPPTDKQRDYIFHALLCELTGRPLDTVTDPIFPVLPSVEADAFQTLLRFPAGKCDFARVHAQSHRLDANLCSLVHSSIGGIALGAGVIVGGCTSIPSGTFFFACPYKGMSSSEIPISFAFFWSECHIAERLDFESTRGRPSSRGSRFDNFILKYRLHRILAAELSRFVFELLSHRVSLYRFALLEVLTVVFLHPMRGYMGCSAAYLRDFAVRKTRIGIVSTHAECCISCYGRKGLLTSPLREEFH